MDWMPSAQKKINYRSTGQRVFGRILKCPKETARDGMNLIHLAGG
jgi:hypothetical protein